MKCVYSSTLSLYLRNYSTSFHNMPFFTFIVNFQFKEHHLQRAISAQQIYGEAQRLIIPTPDAILYESDYKQLKKKQVYMPKQLIHVQGENCFLFSSFYSYLQCLKEVLELYNKLKCTKVEG